MYKVLYPKIKFVTKFKLFNTIVSTTLGTNLNLSLPWDPVTSEYYFLEKYYTTLEGNVLSSHTFGESYYETHLRYHRGEWGILSSSIYILLC